jgi:hypothetical protein
MTASDRRLSSIVVRSGYAKDRLIDLYWSARYDGLSSADIARRAVIGRRAAILVRRHSRLASAWSATRVRLGLNG